MKSCLTNNLLTKTLCKDGNFTSKHLEAFKSLISVAHIIPLPCEVLILKFPDQIHIH